MSIDAGHVVFRWKQAIHGFRAKHGNSCYMESWIIRHSCICCKWQRAHWAHGHGGIVASWLAVRTWLGNPEMLDGKLSKDKQTEQYNDIYIYMIYVLFFLLSLFLSIIIIIIMIIIIIWYYIHKKSCLCWWQLDSWIGYEFWYLVCISHVIHVYLFCKWQDIHPSKLT